MDLLGALYSKGGAYGDRTCASACPSMHGIWPGTGKGGVATSSDETTVAVIGVRRVRSRGFTSGQHFQSQQLSPGWDMAAVLKIADSFACTFATYAGRNCQDRAAWLASHLFTSSKNQESVPEIMCACAGSSLSSRNFTGNQTRYDHVCWRTRIRE